MPLESCGMRVLEIFRSAFASKSSGCFAARLHTWLCEPCIRVPTEELRQSGDQGWEIGKE